MNLLKELTRQHRNHHAHGRYCEPFRGARLPNREGVQSEGSEERAQC